MKLIKKKTLISYLSLLISFLLTEIIFRLISGFTIFNYSFLRAFLIYNVLSILFGYLTSKFKNIHTYIINSILIFIACIYSWLQIGFNNYLSVYMSFKSTSQLGAVASYIKEFLESLKLIDYLLFIPLLLVIIFYIVNNTIDKKNEPTAFKIRLKYRYREPITITGGLILIIVSILSFDILLNNKYQDKTQVISNKKLLKTGANPALCIKEFGVLPYGIIDIYTKNVEVNDDTLLIAYNKEKKEETDYTRHIDDTKWNNLINSETNTNYNNLNNYYINKDITDKNEMTGIFKDKNVIVIMMESANDIIINKEYFPNFYKMYSNGYSFDNNYSPRNSCATGNNEFSSLTSLYSIANTCTMNIYLNNTYDESLFGLFRKNGYTVNSFHNFSEWYYYRSTAHINMGSEKFYGINELGMEYNPVYGEWSSDEELMLNYLDIIDSYDKNKPFLSFITTVSSHMPYAASTEYGDIYLDMTEDSNYSMTMRRYLSKLKVLDNALGILMDGLKDRGILDDTVIVMYGDHYPYGMDEQTIKEVLTRDLTDYNIEKTPLVIYNSATKGEKKDTYTSYINLVPTLANLCDLKYDPRVYEGIDIFSEDYNNIVVFADYSWKNDKAFYDATTGKIKYYTDFTYSDEEIKKINEEIYVKINASTLSIKNNYFNYLEKYIDK